MSETKNQAMEEVKKEVIVMENTEVVVDLEKSEKKAKLKKVAKKVGKVAAFVGVGILGFILGTKSGNKTNNDDSELINVEPVVED